ncbi:MAG: hypothetical protein JWM89_2303 [Acidimicrobiales bacterium]|nr:hypothetical protein [Acidimicrobiales bacterium]
MAAPEFVPLLPVDKPRSYASPPRRDDEWWAVRPAEVVSVGQPDVDAGRMGAPGPDQGYLLKLVPILRPELHLTEGEARADVEAGGAAVALKRASLFGRAPVIHDLRVAYTVWGFVDPSPDPDLVAERRRRFEGVHLTTHHYPELRAVADAVPEATLRLTPAQAAEAYARGWRDLLSL